ncbi:restriction endonuclease [bacterium]|nr:restriction endonuclease [bacterium]
MDDSILKKWQITDEELTHVVESSPSLRGILLGYIAEKKFQDMFLSHPRITGVRKADDHDRTHKGDRTIVYQGIEIVTEVKSLQTNSIRLLSDGSWIGKAQVDASDRREVTLPNGERLTTTCLVAGEFDLLAVNLFAFGETWKFAFARNDQLPRSRWRGYTETQRNYLLATLVDVRWPPVPPFFADPFPLLDAMVRER